MTVDCERILPGDPLFRESNCCVLIHYFPAGESSNSSDRLRCQMLQR